MENMLEGNPLINFIKTDQRITEIEIIDLEQGTGKEVVANSTINAHYTGAKMSNGIVFQSSRDSGNSFTAPLDNLIAGWQQGLIGMKEGGTRRLLIPAELAYGENPGRGMPGGDLVFDIDLIKVF